MKSLCVRTDIVAIGAGDWHTVGIKSDGTVVAVGYEADGATNVSSWYMDPTSGESMAAFKVPKKMTPGSYDVKLINGTGSATFLVPAFTVKSGTSLNTDYDEPSSDTASDE